MILTDCIVLRKTAYGDSSYIVSTLSPDCGRLDLLFRGARTMGKKKFPIIGLFRELSISFLEKNQSKSLISTKSVELKSNFDTIGEHPTLYLSLCQITPILLQNIQHGIPAPLTYQVFRSVCFRWAKGEALNYPLHQLILLINQLEEGTLHCSETTIQNILQHITIFINPQNAITLLPSEFWDFISNYHVKYGQHTL